jgi:uncharacterized protein
MRRSTRSFLFPDVNVWIALTFRGHIHHAAARTWLNSVPDDAELCFCRLTQLGFLRLLTTAAVMGNKVLSQADAWDLYDDWLEHGHAAYVEEPPAIELTFRSLSESRQAAPKRPGGFLCLRVCAGFWLEISDFRSSSSQKNNGGRLVEANGENVSLRPEDQLPLAQHLQFDPPFQRQRIHRQAILPKAEAQTKLARGPHGDRTSLPFRRAICRSCARSR